MEFKDLTGEQKEKAKACAAKTPEELMALAKEEAYELSDEQLGEVAGGTLGGTTCPRCGGTNLKYIGANVTVCEDCGYAG